MTQKWLCKTIHTRKPKVNEVMNWHKRTKSIARHGQWISRYGWRRFIPYSKMISLTKDNIGKEFILTDVVVQPFLNHWLDSWRLTSLKQLQHEITVAVNYNEVLFVYFQKKMWLLVYFQKKMCTLYIVIYTNWSPGWNWKFCLVLLKKSRQKRLFKRDFEPLKLNKWRTVPFKSIHFGKVMHKKIYFLFALHTMTKKSKEYNQKKRWRRSNIFEKKGNKVENYICLNCQLWSFSAVWNFL